MKSSIKKAAYCGLFHALVVIYTIGGAESFHMIKNHRFGSRISLRTLPSSTGKYYKFNAATNVFESDPSDSQVDDSLSSVSDRTRRNGGRIVFQSLLMGAFPWELSNQVANADESSKSVFVSGTVNLPPGTSDPNATNDDETPAKPALYVTVRPNRPDNVPRAILDGSRGKPPPVLAARFESPVFPFDFGLGEKDLTPEGMDTSDAGNYWWSSDDLIVSARWDSDGVAATRSPEDLVGRNLFKKGTTDGFVLDLQGRGSFGKFATKKN